MPGTFSKSNRPGRPGSYTNFKTLDVVRPPAPIAGVVAVPITHDWGPFEVVQRVRSIQEFDALYGDSDTVGRRAVLQVFKGEAVENQGGASEAVVIRMGAAAAAKADRDINNTTPAAAITITARYEGTYGNTLTTQVVANAAAPSTHQDLIISDADGELERFTYVKTEIDNLADDINANSEWVTATSTIDGTALTVDGSAVALSGGNDGSTLIAGDWTAARAALDIERFGVFVPYALTDTALHAAMLAWVQDQNAGGKRFLAVFGGSTATAAQAITDAATFDDPNVVITGGYTVTDETLIDESTGEPHSLTPSAFAPRIAGIIAARGERASISFARLNDVEVVDGPTDAEVLSCLAGGVVTIGQDSHSIAPVRIEKGITSYTSDTDAVPNNIYSQIKFVRTMHGIEMDLTAFAEENVIGKLPVNNGTRETLVGRCTAIIAARADQEIVQDDFTVGIDNDPPATDDDDFIQLEYGIGFSRSIEQVFNTIYVG